MVGAIRKWPAWPEFAHDSSNASDPDFQVAKAAIIQEYGVEALQKAWLKVCEQLTLVTDEIADKGNAIIPIASAPEVLQDGFTSELRERIGKTGCVVVRGIIPKDHARQLHFDLQQYIADNKGSIRAWPAASPSMFELYDSPVQNAVRSNRDHLKLQRMLNELWHDNTGESTADPLVYLDAVRDRPPHQAFLGLGPHIDAGSLSRWADPTYRDAYRSIFSGSPEKYDCWDLSVRQHAVQDMFPAAAHSSVFRAFQGWTALTPAKASEGSILLYPNAGTAMAYLLLRPFFKPPQDSAEVMDASKWAFDESGCSFPGTMQDQSQRLSRSSHPHLRLEECLVHAPDIEPGDTIWWHSDVGF